MKKENISDALNNIDFDMVEDVYESTKAKKKSNKSLWLKWGAIAACLSLIVMGGIFGNLFLSPDTPDIPNNNIMSYFIITAHAANGESTDLALAESCFNSAPAQQGNGFGVDMPLFHFSITPSDLKNNEAIYDRFDISVSYNGSYVKDKDEHISVAYLIPMQNTNESWSYSIMGWFTEPTDIIINIVEKDSREIVETITVNVTYFADKQEYELKITNLTTLFVDQKKAVEAHNELMSYFFSQGYVTNYPEWFGGCYIEGNKLYIKVVSPSDEEMKNASRILAPFDKVIVYKNAEMSMADLQEYADKTANDLITSGYEVTSWYVDSVTGDIVISVLEKDFEAVTDLVNTASQNNNTPKIVIEIGGYIDLD